MNVCIKEKCNRKIRARNLCYFHWSYEQYGQCINNCLQPSANKKGFCYNCIKRKGTPPTTRRDGKCKICGSSLNSALRCNDCRKKQQKNNHLIHKYNITLEKWEQTLSEQNNVCKICKRHSKRFVVDHDHSCCKTQKTCGKCVRGIICENCNRAIGLVNDSEEILLNMVKYLRKS